MATVGVFVPAPGAVAHLNQQIARFFANSLGPAIRDDARAVVPVDTGRLRASLSLDVATPNAAPRLRVGSTDVPYSVYVELGTSRMRAQPYLAPSLFRKRS